MGSGKVFVLADFCLKLAKKTTVDKYPILHKIELFKE
jgi:hypothetical protein